MPGNDERMEGNNCLKIHMSGAGTGILENSSVTTVDCSAMEMVRFWHFVGSEAVSSLKLKLGTDSSNYFEWDCGHMEADCWT
jgi:hypothetical protein